MTNYESSRCLIPGARHALGSIPVGEPVTPPSLAFPLLILAVRRITPERLWLWAVATAAAVALPGAGGGAPARGRRRPPATTGTAPSPERHIR
ncbi:hypothetical protein ABZ905_10795 [Streptomyces parvus]|uniref:hypothetical protein n=1 Tax=Streptomyces parvus TaxID=66428 RepID=UPI00340BEF2A